MLCCRAVSLGVKHPQGRQQVAGSIPATCNYYLEVFIRDRLLGKPGGMKDRRG